jgi:hypothetical protein
MNIVRSAISLRSLISVKLGRVEYMQNSDMSDFDKSDPDPEGDTISAVTMSPALTAQIDAWAKAQGMSRSDAIGRLLELGLNASRLAISCGSPRRAPSEIEHLAEEQIDRLLDPELSVAERERRVRRLTEGPPEFTDQRIDVARRRK